MSDKKIRRLPLAAAAMVACMSAHAGYTSPDGNFSLSGFGTLSAVKLDTDDAKFNNKGQGGGAGKDFDMSPDSKIAVQGTYKFTPTVSATAQVMTKYDADGAYVPGFEWAFAKWQVTPGFSLRAGQMGAPFFMISDYREVSYANLWVRTPVDVYGQVPFNNFVGADATYQMNLGSTALTTSVLVGNADTDFALSSLTTPAKIKLKHMRGINVQAELDGGITLRFGHTRGKLTIDSGTATLLANGGASCAAGYASLNPALAAACAQVTSVMTVEDENAAFTGVGISVDRDNWVGSLEYTKRKTDSFIADTTGWYASLGYRIGKLTPYVTASKIKVDSLVQNPMSAYLPSTLASNTEAFLGAQFTEQRSTGLGVRWDVMNNLALKAQWDRISKPADSAGMFYLTQKSVDSGFFDKKQTVNAVTLSVDFVF